MSFAFSFDNLSPAVVKLINTKCSVKAKASQYVDKPVVHYCFTTDKTLRIAHVPLGLWSDLYESFPNLCAEHLPARFKFTTGLFTAETDPAGRGRDQIDVAKSAIALLRSQHHVFLALHTGFGKTTIGVYLSAILRYKTVVICHLQTVCEQWLETFQRFSTAKIQWVKGTDIDPDSDIYIIGAQKMMNMLTANPAAFEAVGTIIVDEAHIATTKIFTSVLTRVQPRYLIGLSATPERDDNLHKLLHAYFGPPDKYVSRFEIKRFMVKRMATGIEPEVDLQFVKGRFVPNWNTMMNSIAYHEKRNLAIARLAAKRSAEHRIIIMCGRVQQAREIAGMLENMEQDCDTLIGKKSKYRAGCRILVAGVKKAGVGFDDSGLTMMIVTCSLKNVKQVEGRIRTTNNIIYDLVDNHPTFEKHWQIRRKWYESRGATIVGDKKMKTVDGQRTKYVRSDKRSEIT